MAANPKTVMIVEDEPDAAELFAEMMRVSGYEVHKASDVRKGLDTRAFIYLTKPMGYAELKSAVERALKEA